jgi:hypothetical protein
MGGLDVETVQGLVKLALGSDKSAGQIQKAEAALTQDFDKRHEQAKSDYARKIIQCTAEYLKELGRIIKIYGKHSALDPKTDAEIAIKLRMAGFSLSIIYQVISSQSPLAIALPDKQSKAAYVVKGLKPHIQNSNVWNLIRKFNYERRQQAYEKFQDPNQQMAYINEYRLDKLAIATT